MATAERRAEVVWEGDLPHGSGRLIVGSGAMDEQPVTWVSRTERSDGKICPEELIAAHGSCFAMALSRTSSPRNVRLLKDLRLPPCAHST